VSTPSPLGRKSLNPLSVEKHDDYMTPAHAWKDVAPFIPADKVIWEAFYGDGTSGEHLRSLGFEVIHDDIDFFEHDLGDIIVSNPPFSKAKTIIPRLKALDKPFILIMPSSKINTGYVRESFKGNLQIIIPPKRINFIKLVNGEVPEGWDSQCSFDCFYYCYKIGLPRDIVWLD